MFKELWGDEKELLESFESAEDQRLVLLLSCTYSLLLNNLSSNPAYSIALVTQESSRAHHNYSFLEVISYDLFIFR